MANEKDMDSLKGRIRMLGLKISNEEILRSPLSDEQLTDLHENLKYLASKIKGLEAKGVEGCCNFQLDRNRSLNIIISDGKTHLYVQDVKEHTISQMVTIKDLERISRNDAYVLKILENPDRYIDRTEQENIMDGFSKLEEYVSSNATRGAPVDHDYCLDDDFEL